MVSMVLQCLIYFLRFHVIEYERPHSKTLEAPSLAGTKGKNKLYFKTPKYYFLLNLF
jgi:hypothetical protein